jgi:hypothetical protein
VPPAAPLCPAKLVTLPDGKTGVIFNAIMGYSHQCFGQRWDLGTMASADGGATWENYRSLEFMDPHVKRPGLFYCYPATLFDRERLHLAYYGPVEGRTFNLVCRQAPASWFSDKERNKP